MDGFHIASQSNFLVASHSGTGFNSSTYKIKMIDDVHVYASFCKIFIDILAVSTVSKKELQFFNQIYNASLRSTLFYMLPMLPCLAYSVYFGGFLVQFLVEKLGMMGALPPPYG